MRSGGALGRTRVLVARALAIGVLGAGWVHADDPATPPAPAAASSPAEAAAPPVSLFPFGIREDARPDRQPEREKARADAVAQGLRWLAAHQSPSGLWKAADLGWCDGKEGRKDLQGGGYPGYDVGVSGLALLAFATAGYAPRAGDPYEDVIARGLAALVDAQDAGGCVGPRTTLHFLYGHAFATQALVDAYGATGDVRWRRAAGRAIDFALAAQNPGLAWRYGVRPGDNDTSETGCLALALLAARRVNRAAMAADLAPPFPIPAEAFTGIRTWIDQMTDEVGRTGYIQRGGLSARLQEEIDRFPCDETETCTAIGLFLRDQIPGDDPRRDAATNEKAAGLLRVLPPRWDTPGGYTDLYYWHYGALALSARDDPGWPAWRRALEQAVVGAQRHDGDACAYKGSWDTDSAWSADAGRVYTTAMCVLLLETPSHFPTLPADRSDLVTALQDTSRPAAEKARILDAVALYRLAPARAEWARLASDPDPQVRAALARAVAALEPDARDVKRLAGMLADASPAVRLAAARALAGLQAGARPALDDLVRTLDTEDVRLRAAALEAISSVGTDAATSADRLRALLADPAPPVRVGAAAALSHVAPDAPDVERALLRGLDESDETVRATAAAALADRPRPSDEVLDALQKALVDRAPRVRVEAARGLATTKRDPASVLEILGTALQSAEPRMRLVALRIVVRLGTGAMEDAPFVSECALHGAPRERAEALGALGALGKDAPGGLAAISACRADESATIRAAAEAAWTGMSLAPGEAVPALVPALEAPDPRVVDGAVAGLVAGGRPALDAVVGALRSGREAAWAGALRVIAGLGSEARDAAPDVIRVGRQAKDARVRALAARAIGRIGAPGPDGIDALVQISDSTDADVRRASLEALARLAADEPEAVRALARLGDDKSLPGAARRREALETLASLGPAAEPASATFTAAMDDPDDAVREAGIAAMAAVGKGALDVLQRMTRDPADRVRSSALDAIGRMGAVAAKLVPDLCDGLAAQQDEKMYEYSRALAGIGKPAVHALIRLLKDDSAFARSAAAYALELIGPDAKSAEHALKALKKDPDENVRKRAAAALEKIRPHHGP